MSDRAALLANVLDASADDTARLVDRLEENGEEAFGQFLRAGALAAQLQARDQFDEPTSHHLLQSTAKTTTTGAPARRLSALEVGPVLSLGAWVRDNAGERVTVREAKEGRTVSAF